MLSEVIHAAIEINHPLIDQLGHALTLDGLERPIVLEADAARLTQVFGNLLNNALKYSVPDGRIDLSVRREGDCAVVSVRDAGIGIPADMLDRVFELFTQADAARDHSPGGLRIGLSLAHRLVEMHGGTIRVTSAGPARGSEFTVRLPALDVDYSVTERPHAGRPSDPAPLRRRVLVVDDNVDGADSLAMLLLAMECDVRTAYDGEMAIREAEQFRPEVLLLDIGMPGIDGYETCHRIRTKTWGAAMTLIALTGWGKRKTGAAAPRRVSTCIS